MEDLFDMKYSELKKVFQDLKRNSPGDDLTAHITFTEDSFTSQYSLLSRTYRVSSDNKAFWPSMGGYSIFASCLDVATDKRVRLDWYMAEEGNAGGWKVENCYILEKMRDADAIPSAARTEQEDGSICYFFGDTCIRANESIINGRVHLMPLSGDQMACGEWEELSIDQVYGYCTLLARCLNRRIGYE